MVVSLVCKCCQESDKVWVNLAAKLFQCADLVPEFFKSSLSQSFDGKDSAGNVDLQLNQIHIRDGFREKYNILLSICHEIHDSWDESSLLSLCLPHRTLQRLVEPLLLHTMAGCPWHPTLDG